MGLQEPKSLIKVDGASLIERQIKLFHSHGVTHFLVVVGWRSEALVREIKLIASSCGITIGAVLNEKWQLENGYSLYCAKEWLEREGFNHFYFTMADHFFSAQFLDDALANIRFEGNNLLQLIVDKPDVHNQHIDIDDVTKVYAEKNQIIKIGKNITHYNYYDTGLFAASTAIYRTLELLASKGSCSISEMVSSLISLNQAGITLVGSFFWNDVDTPEDLVLTLEILKNRSENGS